MSNFPTDFVPSTKGIKDCTANLSLADKWILNQLNTLV